MNQQRLLEYCLSPWRKDPSALDFRLHSPSLVTLTDKMRTQLQCLLLLSVVVSATTLAEASEKRTPTVFARARLNPLGGSKASGIVELAKTADGLLVQVDIVSTAPGAHGIHIHEETECNSFRGIIGGGHWNPTKKGHGSPQSRFSHVGDLGNILAVPDQTGTMTVLLRRNPKRFGGWDRILGRVVVMHETRDNLKSNPDGTSGPAIACGRIERVENVAE